MDKLNELLTLMACLRSPDAGCPWDQKQTYRTIAPYTIEEAYEVADAILRDDLPHLKEELGDLLFQVVFYCQMAKEENAFEFEDVVSGLTEKMLRRHPHVFPDGSLDSFGRKAELSPREVHQQWDEIKASEKKHRTGLLDDVPASFPPLMQAVKLQKRAAKVGFDWGSVKPVIAKIREELDELEEAIEHQDQAHTEEELGDLLFAMANLARHVKVDPEQAVMGTNQKFRRRFKRIEELSAGQGKELTQMTLDEMDAFWDQAKSEGL